MSAAPRQQPGTSDSAAGANDGTELLRTYQAWKASNVTPIFFSLFKLLFVEGV